MQQSWQDRLREASNLRAMGRVSEAIAAYKAVLAVKPDLPDSWYNLAWLQKQGREFEEALQSYQRALDLNVSEPEEVHVNRAVILADHLHRPDEAEHELRAALDKNEAYVPALLNLGNLREDLGDRAGARESYERALAVEPDNSLALARLAGVSQAAELDTSLAQRLRVTMARPDIPQAERADVGFALAGLLDAAGQYDEAFETARTANELSRAAAGPAARYDRAAVENYFDRLIRAFDRPVSSSNEAAFAPLFICGMFRSGSTLVEQILAAHSRVRAGGELDLIPALVSNIRNYPESAAAADAQSVQRWREFYASGLPVEPTGQRIVTDKRPDNFLHIGLIKMLFPRAKIVHTRRHPLDNLISLYFLHLDPGMSYALDLDDSVHWYGQYLRLMEHWHALYRADILDVDYDELVRAPRAAIEPLLGFCGLDWEESVLDFHRSRAAVKTASVWQVRQPLHARSSGRWRNYERFIASAKRSLGLA